MCVVLMLSHINACPKSIRKVRDHTKKVVGAVRRSEQPNGIEIRPGKTTLKKARYGERAQVKLSNVQTELAHGRGYPLIHSINQGIFFLRGHTSTLQLLDKATWSQVSSRLPPGSCLQFYRAWGSAIPLFVDFSWSVVADSRSRAFRKSICAQEKAPSNLYEYALGGARIHESGLYEARGQPDTPPGRPA